MASIIGGCPIGFFYKRFTIMYYVVWIGVVLGRSGLIIQAIVTKEVG